jgi:hypothetical protein
MSETQPEAEAFYGCLNEIIGVFVGIVLLPIVTILIPFLLIMAVGWVIHFCWPLFLLIGIIWGVVALGRKRRASAGD